ncbi:MAG: cytochrome c biogenesis protein CcdA [Nitrospirae bacterium]|nr:cytochrome c biogenesis protein CcdA [Nitrospirota bacterium]
MIWGEAIPAIIQGQPILAFGAAFLGGLMSAASPCVLATIPLVIGYVGGYSGGDKRKALLYSLSFILGLSVNFTLLGVAASALGGLMAGLGVWLYAGVAAVAIVMGLSLMGLFEVPALVRSDIKPKTRGLAGAFMMGFIFGMVSSPCATPALAVIIAYVASEGRVAYGGALLFVYALGHCVLIFAAGMSVGFVNGFIGSKGLVSASSFIKKASGALLVGVGIYVVAVYAV